VARRSLAGLLLAMVIFACLGASHDLAHRPSALEREFGSELSPPGTDHGGETYLDKGDGLIAMWNQADAFRCAAISGL
jgi:hypothetical protein